MLNITQPLQKISRSVRQTLESRTEETSYLHQRVHYFSPVEVHFYCSRQTSHYKEYLPATFVRLRSTPEKVRLGKTVVL